MRTILAAAALTIVGLGRCWAADAGPTVLELDGKLGGLTAFQAKGDTLKLDAPFWLSKHGRAILRVAGGVVQVKGPAQFTPRADGFALKLGSLLSVLPKLKGREWRVRTPAAVAAVRGTEFFIEAERDGGTYLCLCRGALDVTPAHGAGAPTHLKAEHHSEFELRDQGGTLSQTPAGMRDHSDAEVQALVKLAQ